MDLRQGRPSDSQEPAEGPESRFKAGLSGTGAFKLHTGNFPGLTSCTLFPNQEMGKSLSAQWGGELTQTLALGSKLGKGAPWQSTCSSPDAGNPCPLLQLTPRVNSGCGLGSQSVGGEGRGLFLCPPSLFLPGFPWWLLPPSLKDPNVLLLALLCAAALKPNHTVYHPLITISRGS